MKGVRPGKQVAKQVRVSCPECHYSVRVRKDATVMFHNLWVGGVVDVCSGSYTRVEVPR